MENPSYKLSMRDIAKEAGVSVSAVSLALRNSPKVSKKRRDEITKIAERMGYVKDGRISELMEHLRTNRTDRKFSKAFGNFGHFGSQSLEPSSLRAKWQTIYFCDSLTIPKDVEGVAICNLCESWEL